jgi:hypothetical protein
MYPMNKAKAAVSRKSAAAKPVLEPKVGCGDRQATDLVFPH